MTSPRTGKTTLDTARRLHDRIRTVLEWLGSSAPRTVRDALLAEAGAAFARTDVAALEKLLRQVHALARSVGTPLDGAQLNRTPANPLRRGSTSRDAGPGLPAWGSPPPLRRVTHSAPGGENAPIKYPWGGAPAREPEAAPQHLPATLAGRTVPDEQQERPRWRVSAAARKWILVPRTPAQWEREQREWRALRRATKR